jgi:putative peptidoglycan lipid II flippase
MSKMLKSSGAMALATLTSRVLGMVREMVYMGFMGVGWINDAFQMAFMIPNLFRRLLGEGALTAAFIPIFKEKEKNHGETEMWRASNAVISGLIVAASVVIALVLIGVSLALAMHQFEAKTDLMLCLLRVMFPYMLLVCLTAAMMGMLNARGHFFIPAMGATTLNVVMIASVLWLAPRWGHEKSQQIFALAIGVLVAGVAQAAFQLPTLFREGFRFRWVPPWNDETVRQVIYKMIPGTLGVAAFQINVVFVQSLGFAVGDGIVSSFNGAVRLMELPQGMFGISLATYLLPTLSGLAVEKNFAEFRNTLRQGLGYLLTVNLLASLFLVVLAEPIVRLLFQRGAFDAADTGRVSFALICLAPGLVVFSMVNILARAFYALGDTKTPMRISIFCLGLNLVFALALVWKFQQGGLGIANTLSAVCNATLLSFALRKKLGRLDWAEVRGALVALLLAAIAAGLLVWLTADFWARHYGHAHLWTRVGEVFVPIILGTGIYFAIAAALRVPYVKELFAMLPFKRGRSARS